MLLHALFHLLNIRIETKDLKCVGGAGALRSLHELIVFVNWVGEVLWLLAALASVSLVSEAQ